MRHVKDVLLWLCIKSNLNIAKAAYQLQKAQWTRWCSHESHHELPAPEGCQHWYHLDVTQLWWLRIWSRCWRHEEYTNAKICAAPHLSTFGPGHKVLLRRDIRRLLDILTRKHFERNTTRYILEGASYSWLVFWELGWHLFFAVKLCIFDIHCMVATEDTCAGL